MKVLVTGASGVLGRAVADITEEAGHEVLRGGRNGPVRFDARDPTTFSVAADCDVVIHCASDIRHAKAVEVDLWPKLRAAAPHARLVYPSIVGCDRIKFSYYRVKTAGEAALVAAGGDHAVLRITQFHEFADRLARLPIPMDFVGMKAQTIAAKDPARALVDVALSKVQGRAPDVGGPEVHAMADLIKQRLRADGRKRPVLRLPIGTKGFRAGHNLCPDQAVGTTTWAEHLG